MRRWTLFVFLSLALMSGTVEAQNPTYRRKAINAVDHASQVGGRPNSPTTTAPQQLHAYRDPFGRFGGPESEAHLQELQLQRANEKGEETKQSWMTFVGAIAIVGVGLAIAGAVAFQRKKKGSPALNPSDTKVRWP